MTSTTKPKTITLARIRALGASPQCRHYRKVAEMYPNGVPFTYEAAIRLYEAHVDVMHIIPRLLSYQARREFILFTIRQRRPHLATLLHRVNLTDHAEKIAALSVQTVADAKDAALVFSAAVVAAADAAADAAAGDVVAAADAHWAADAAADAAAVARWADADAAHWAADAAADAAAVARWADADAARWAADAARWAAADAARWAADAAVTRRDQIGWIARNLDLPDAPPDPEAVVAS